jgi:hypothetical protein
MKTFRLILLSTAALALLTVTGVNIHLNKIVSSKDSDVTLKNIEALSGEFDFNGQSWNTDDTHTFGSNWYPSLHDCHHSSTTGWDFNPSIFGISLGSWAHSSGTDEYDGEQISCIGGNGDCWNGTSCIPVPK